MSKEKITDWAEATKATIAVFESSDRPNKAELIARVHFAHAMAVASSKTAEAIANQQWGQIERIAQEVKKSVEEYRQRIAPKFKEGGFVANDKPLPHGFPTGPLEEL